MYCTKQNCNWMNLKPNIQTNTDLNEPKLTQQRTKQQHNDDHSPKWQPGTNWQQSGRTKPPSYDTACTINNRTTRRRRNTNRNSTSLIQLRDNLQTIRQRLNLLEEPIDGDNVNRQHFEILILPKAENLAVIKQRSQQFATSV